jgi:hypothetical protein
MPGPEVQEEPMPEHRIYTTPFADVYPLYLQKAERKGRSKEEVDQVICWLTGYSPEGLAGQAPAPNPHAALITGVVCGVRVEQVEDPLMKSIRQLDKLVDELAKGRPLEKILRRPV